MNGKVLLEFYGRLGESWEDLADILEIPARDKRAFRPGNEPRQIRDWLVDRGKEDLLPDALNKIGREDLAQLLAADRARAGGRSPTGNTAERTDDPVIPGNPPEAVEFEEVAVVSCDILGHSATNGGDQVRRVTAINKIVADTIRRCAGRQVVWSSGGDGGHVIFFGENWHVDVVLLLGDLWSWAHDEGIPLRITGHVGKVATIVGADERVQAVGAGINFAGWLIRQATGDGIVVSDAFRRGISSTLIALSVSFHNERLRVDRTTTRQLLSLMSFDGVSSKWPEGEQDDYNSLKESLAEGNGWEALYYAKRISQMNAADEKIEPYLEEASRLLKSDTLENRSFLELLRPDELTAMLKLGHLVERARGDIICQVNDPGESLFVILHGEVGVYNLEGKGYGGTAEPKHVHLPGEIVGELATVLKRTRTADLVAMSDVALLSFIGEEVQDRFSNADKEAVRDAARQWHRFLLDRVVQHTIQVARYLLGSGRRGPLSVAPALSSPRDSGLEPWKANVRALLPETELVTVADGGFTLEIAHVTAELTKMDPERGVFILVSGSVRSQTPVKATLSGAECPLLWVDVPKVFAKQASTYERVDEPIMVLWIGARGVGRLSLKLRQELHETLESAVGRVPPEYEYDVYLCHAGEDRQAVLELKNRLWAEHRIRAYYDDMELQPDDSTRKAIEKGLMTGRFLLLCATANLNATEWASRGLDSLLNLDVDRPGEPHVLVLKLHDHESVDEAIPEVFRDAKRQYFRQDRDFEDLCEYIRSARTPQDTGDGE
ncbi:cyclic nucleotide-binding domain-containing protein [Amycolatopsis sp. NPDC004169]|uniref:cyclic nucleotide-binding domain-containing protein n=1 Tax=Amycolatopsis sp. NPDC004169 TaxID=3154453 RepID=UPI0033AE41B8